jgi:RNA polymerase sigma-70 factor, ECF subfamily
MTESTLPTTTADTEPTDLGDLLEQHRVALTGYCYRMLGSSFEAEDAVQETFVRAWRAYERFEGRSALKSWLYRIATNVCIDALNGRNRRERPVDISSPWTVDSNIGEARRPGVAEGRRPR